MMLITMITLIYRLCIHEVETGFVCRCRSNA